MASINKMPDGSWEVRLTSGTGRNRKQKRKRGFTTQKAAKIYAAEIESRLMRGQKEAGSAISFADYFKKWVNVFKRGKHSASTDNWYDTAHKYITDYFGDTRLSSITRTDYQQFINELGTTPSEQTGKPLARTTVARVNNYVKGVVESAIDDGIVASNFTRKIEVIGSSSKPASEKYLEVNEFERLIKLANSRADMRHISNYVILIQAYTGARFEEAIGLTWDKIDFKNKTVSIERSWAYKTGGGFSQLKTPSSHRTVAVPSAFLTIMNRLKKEQRELFMKQGYRDEYDMVIRDFDHRVIVNASVNATLKRLCAKLNTKNVITSHGLRHTHGSMLIYQGVDIVSVSRRLGHADLQTTMNVYIHEMDAMKARGDAQIIAILESI